MNEKFKILSNSPIVFKVLAWVGLVFGVAGAGLILFGADDSGTPRWMGFITLIGGAVYFFIFFVAAEGVSLLLDMDGRIK